MIEPATPSPTLFDLLDTTEPETIGPNAVNDLSPEEEQEVWGVVQEVARNPIVLLDTRIVSGLAVRQVQALIQLLFQSADPTTESVLPGETNPSTASVLPDTRGLNSLPPWWNLDPAASGPILDPSLVRPSGVTGPDVRGHDFENPNFTEPGTLKQDFYDGLDT